MWKDERASNLREGAGRHRILPRPKGGEFGGPVVAGLRCAKTIPYHLHPYTRRSCASYLLRDSFSSQ